MECFCLIIDVLKDKRIDLVTDFAFTILRGYLAIVLGGKIY
jgi:hypothetical protein